MYIARAQEILSLYLTVSYCAISGHKQDHIAILITYAPAYTLPFTLQLCYKPLGTLYRVTKSQKFQISGHDVL